MHVHRTARVVMHRLLLLDRRLVSGFKTYLYLSGMINNDFSLS